MHSAWELWSMAMRWTVRWSFPKDHNQILEATGAHSNAGSTTYGVWMGFGGWKCTSFWWILRLLKGKIDKIIQSNTKYVNCFSKLFQLQSGICWDELSFGLDHPYKVISVCGTITGSLIMTPYYNRFRLAASLKFEWWYFSGAIINETPSITTWSFLPHGRRSGARRRCRTGISSRLKQPEKTLVPNGSNNPENWNVNFHNTVFYWKWMVHLGLKAGAQ